MADEPQAKKPRTESDADNAPEAVKEEPDKKDVAKDEEMKEEDKVKQEVKEEEKAEVEDEAADEKQDVLDDLLQGDESESAGAKASGTKTKKKKKAAHEGEPEEQALPEVEPVETDSEYQEVDIENYPPRLKVEACSYSKINGVYRKLPKPSRGRPSYCNTSGNKHVFLYNYKGKWQFCTEFGSKRSMATCTEVDSTTLPVEPYPNVWKVMPKSDKKEDKEKGEDKKKENKIICMAMRVIDYAFLEESHVFEGSNLIIPDEVIASSVRTVAAEGDKPDEMASPAKTKSHKKKKSSEPAGSPKKPSSSTSQPSEGGKEAVDDDAAMVAEFASSDEEGKAAASAAKAAGADSDSNESDDASSSEESSSSDSEQEAEQAEQAPAMSDDLQALSPQVRSLALKLKDDKEGKGKAQRLIQQMRKNPSKASRFTAAEIEQIVAWCCSYFGVPDVPPESAAPTTPPATNQPTTPPMDAGAAGPVRRNVNDVMPHRMPHPNLKSVMKPPGRGRNFRRRITYNQVAMRIDTAIVSYKTAGEGLWHQAPGAMVQCDFCERSVPQAMGSLQGAPSRSQFAQCAFACNDCAGRGQM